MKLARSVSTVLLVAACGQPAQEGPRSAEHGEDEHAGPVIDPTARAACEAGLGNIPIAVTLPPGVTEDTTDRTAIITAAANWDVPAGVTFALDGAPRVASGIVTLRGELVNTTDAPVEVFLSEAGVGYFTATLTGDDLVRRAMPPSPSSGGPPRPVLFPEPHRFTLGPGVHFPLETSVTLACWEITPPRTVTAHWWLNLEGEGREGDVQVALAAP